MFAKNRYETFGKDLDVVDEIASGAGVTKECAARAFDYIVNNTVAYIHAKDATRRLIYDYGFPISHRIINDVHKKVVKEWSFDNSDPMDIVEEFYYEAPDLIYYDNAVCLFRISAGDITVRGWMDMFGARTLAILSALTAEEDAVIEAVAEYEYGGDTNVSPVWEHVITREDAAAILQSQPHMTRYAEAHDTRALLRLEISKALDAASTMPQHPVFSKEFIEIYAVYAQHSGDDDDDPWWQSEDARTLLENVVEILNTSS